ncbi:MAG: alpha/beta hydrolase family protein [Solirubrobacteraceae bacterium]
MTFLFTDDAFSFEALRVTGYACYGGADLGEVIVTARQIPDGDEAAWHAHWKQIAERLHSEGEQALRNGHRITARETFLRASNYYRTADFYLREDPAHDPEVALLSQRVRESFAAAAGLLDPPAEQLAIPFEGTTLPGYLFRPDHTNTPRPTLIYHGGYDSVLEEAYFVAAAAATRRGYNCIAFDGPGQGAVLRDQGLTFRPDWETVVGAVIDTALRRPEVDPDRIALMGTSLGGFLAARAAAFEHRLAALILHDAIFDIRSGLRSLPTELLDMADDDRDDDFARGVEPLIRQSTFLRWFLRNGAWAFGTASAAALIRAANAYNLEGIASQIDCPTLVLEAENDHQFAGEADRVRQALRTTQRHMLLTDSDGGGEHCHEGAMLTLHHHAFDWLDDTLQPPNPRQRDTIARTT